MLQVSKVKQKMKEGQTVIRAFLRFPNPGAAEIMVLSGVDLVVLDQEHYPFNAQEIEAIVRAVQSFGGECMVRVPNTEPARIAQVMESGVCGVVVPHIETYEEAMEVVNAVKYAPIGKRGFCPITRAAAYGMGMNAKEYANAVLGGKLEYEWDDIIPVACYAKNDTQILIVSGDAPYLSGGLCKSGVCSALYGPRGSRRI